MCEADLLDNQEAILMTFNKFKKNGFKNLNKINTRQISVLDDET